MKSCIIFGAGEMGRKAYIKLSNFFDIQYYSDNDKTKHGKFLNNKEIISPEKAVELSLKENIQLVICSGYYIDIIISLKEKGINDFIVVLDGYIYNYDIDDGVLIDYECEKPKPYLKESIDEKNILFVQNHPCIRTNKIAKIIKEYGYKVFLMYVDTPSVDGSYTYKEIYSDVFTFTSLDAMLNFVNESEFDLIHSSNEPDDLTVLLLNSNKKIVYDCHDMESIRGSDNSSKMTLEYIACTQSDGVMYTSQGVNDIAYKKYHRTNNILVLENMIYEPFILDKKKEKLSNKDGEIHCVFEGGIITNNINSHRYMNSMWQKFAEQKIHIHFYSTSNINSCLELDNISEYIHYEGKLPLNELISEMTKYDCGLALFNVTERNKAYLKSDSFNKMYEYINSQLPIVTNMEYQFFNCDIEEVSFLLDFDKDIRKQIITACNIKVPEDYLEKHDLIMKARGPELFDFYNKISN